MSTVFTFEIGLESKVGLAPILDIENWNLKEEKIKLIGIVKKIPKKSLKNTINVIE